MSGRQSPPALGARVLLAAVRVYQQLISPVLQALGAECRFHPTCSAYAAEVIAQQGAAVGVIRSIRRLLRCHPWHPGGFDPPYPERGPHQDGRRFE